MDSKSCSFVSAHHISTDGTQTCEARRQHESYKVEKSAGGLNQDSSLTKGHKSRQGKGSSEIWQGSETPENIHTRSRKEDVQQDEEQVSPIRAGRSNRNRKWEVSQDTRG